MSLSYLRDAVINTLQKRVDTLGGQAINMRIRPAGSDTPAMTTDEYALLQSDTLAQARAYAEAIKVITAEYAKMIEPEKRDAEPAREKPVAEKNIYG